MPSTTDTTDTTTQDLVAAHWGAVFKALGHGELDGPTCSDCGDPAFATDDGAMHHGEAGDVDSDADAEHEVLALDEPEGPEWSTYDDDVLEVESEEWLALDDGDADGHAHAEVERLLWAFNASFLAGETGIDEAVFTAIAANERCEDNNDAILSIIKGTCGLESFVESAVGCDGRAHFLSGYDGNVIEVTCGDTMIFFYRTN